MLAKLKGKRGFTLVELMIVVAIIGVLAALAIYGVRRYVANAKSAEARMGIGRIAKDASSAWDKEGMAATAMALGASTGVNHTLCGTIAGTTPATAMIQGMKYQSTPSEWRKWSCLGFSMNDPQYYAYSYTKAGTDGTASFTATANGDLNGDGVLSTFSMTGAERLEGTSVTLVIAPNIAESNPTE